MYSELQESLHQGSSITDPTHPHPSLLGQCKAWEIESGGHLQFFRDWPRPSLTILHLSDQFPSSEILAFLKIDTRVFHLISAPQILLVLLTKFPLKVNMQIYAL